MSFDALGGEFAPQVNLEVMQQYIQRKVRLVGELMTVDNDVAVVKASDGSQVNIQLHSRALPVTGAMRAEFDLNLPTTRDLLSTCPTLDEAKSRGNPRSWPCAACSFDTKYIEFTGTVANPNTIKEEEHWEFGNEFGAPPCLQHGAVMRVCLVMADSSEHDTSDVVRQTARSGAHHATYLAACCSQPRTAVYSGWPHAVLVLLCRYAVTREDDQISECRLQEALHAIALELASTATPPVRAFPVDASL